MPPMTLNCTWQDMMREAIPRLAGAGVEHPAREARMLLAHALGIAPVNVIIREMDAVDPAGLTAFEQAIQRRLNHEPVSRIRGSREFYGRSFIVTPDVLDPRPETELLVEEGLKRLPPNGRVLDLGTGSGCILLSILGERSDASGVGVDISPAALTVAKRNAEALQIGRATFIEGSWEAGLAQAPFDLVLSNPPYIPDADIPGLAPDVRNYDPGLALAGGTDGLDPYRVILGLAERLLKPGASIGVEFGLGQGETVASLMAKAGLTDVMLLKDLAGHERAAFSRRP
ncbi:MAG TPA: peptide chain release factor N(5)-glutamine methyltransferase [Hyphomonadaceae bacterium]|nr:peptide chain release factor N(5)-glutamine methyltransferase [Hyphomonadaceae bacterium]